MATSDTPGAKQTPPPSANNASSKNQRHADFYDTQFIVGRLKGEQRKSRLRFYLVAVVLAVVVVALYTLTARRAEAPKALQTQPVVLPAAEKKTSAPAHKDKRAPKALHK